MPKASLLQILIVDDQRSMRSLVRSSLLQLGCDKVIEAEHGADALSRLEIQPAHLIISDLNMPILDGLGLLRAVRESATLKDTAFIMLTSRGDGDLVRQAMALRVNNYLVKPFSVDGLRRKVEAVVGVLT
jgi:two-component system chemotaxis response regulator CheY